MENKVLIVAAHPDDEILGCGGTIAKLVKSGYEAYVLILGEGITSRDEKRNINKRKKDINELKKQAYRAKQIIGVKEVFIYDFPDNRFDTVALLDIVKVIEKIKNKVRPGVIFTHSGNDLNIDHQITYRATLTATRPLKQESVKEIYSFEIPSSTGWNYPCRFNPNLFVDIKNTLAKKIKALGVYKKELRIFPHPRSKGAVISIAKRWGSLSGLSYAEAFEIIRILK